MDMSRLKRLGAGGALVAFSISGVSGSQAADLAAVKAPAAISGPAVSAPVVSSRVARVAPVVQVIPKVAAPVAVVTGTPVIVVKTVVARANTGSAQIAQSTNAKVTKRAKHTKPTVVPKPRTVVKRTATSKPTPRTVTRPPAASKPSVTTTTAAKAYQAPSISYAGSSCRKTGAGEWTITHRWTASGGTYADLGSAQNRISPVAVTGGTRSWTFVSTENGSSVPEVTDAYLGRIVAPIGKTGDVTAWRSIERSKDMVAVSC